MATLLGLDAPAVTYWNGQRTPCRRVRVVVGGGVPATWWCAGLAGTEREAVEVNYAGDTFLLDDEDGSGWAKVTTGRGGPDWGHKSLPANSRVVAELPPLNGAETLLNSAVVLGAAQAEQERARGEYRLRYLGDPILTTPCEPVQYANDLDPNLLPAMRRILAQCRGVGLSANQVGSLQRVALLIDNQRREVPAVNPRILSFGGEQVAMREGCLSIPTFTTTTKRWTVVVVAYQEPATMNTKRLTLEGLAAQCAQHELDHLDGRLLVAGLSRQQRRQAERLTEKHRREVRG